MPIRNNVAFMAPIIDGNNNCFHGIILGFCLIKNGRINKDARRKRYILIIIGCISATKSLAEIPEVDQRREAIKIARNANCFFDIPRLYAVDDIIR